jgi:hypothetical protein
MKYVQILILLFLVVSAGLLFQIYRGQQAPQLKTAVPVAEMVPAPPETTVAPEPAPAAVEPAPEPAKPKPVRIPKAAPVKAKPAETPVPAPVETVAKETQPPAPATGVEIAGLPVGEPAPPPPPPQPRTVTLAAGEHLTIRLSHSLSTERNLSGDTFYANLDEPIIIDGMVIAKKGARVEGRVLEAQQAGRVKGLSKLSIELVRLDAADGQTIGIVTSKIHVQGEETKGDDAKKVGIGAGVGAIIGAIAGGGKGAAIGAGVGAGAGGGAVAATRGKPAEIASETRLTFRLLDPVEVVEKL